MLLLVGWAMAGTPWAEGDWVALENGPQRRGNQDDLWCFDADRCVAVNGGGAIWRTEDGGQAWTQTVDQPGTFFRAVAFLDDAVGIAANIGPGVYPGVEDTTVLYRTTDGGLRWEPVQHGSDAVPGICNLHPVDADTLWASGRVGGPSWIGKSLDAGVSWTWFDLADKLEMVIDLEMSAVDTGIVIGSFEGRARVLRTEDGGATWSIVFDGDRQGELPWKISFPTRKVGFIGMQNYGSEGATRILRTRDGGRSFEAMEALDHPYRVKGLGFASKKVGWIAGEDQAYATRDGGRTWMPVDGLTIAVNRFRFPAKGVGYAIGTSVWKLDVR